MPIVLQSASGCRSTESRRGGAAGCVTLGFARHLSRHQEDNIPTFNPYYRAWRRQILALARLFICTHLRLPPPHDRQSVHSQLRKMQHTARQTAHTMSLFFKLAVACGLWCRKIHPSRAMCRCIIFNHN